MGDDDGESPDDPCVEAAPCASNNRESEWSCALRCIAGLPAGLAPPSLGRRFDDDCDDNDGASVGVDPVDALRRWPWAPADDDDVDEELPRRPLPDDFCF